ncbi:DUF4398 domain-containing protein [Methylomonas koyamae]|uniref:DUF4398 domain-containing protein n=1 Tax=Methylomonas koyamae TaxID=702114 RepID=UPI000BC2F90E|nr:DUF4398 domain-containing protein [Methylomonas koyamae]ATG90116.1 hypothetical protein MKLM6_1881 [Methylomonas koyamae]
MKNINHPGFSRSLPGIGLCAAAVVFIGGCASMPPPTEQMAVSKAAVISANSAGGNEYAPIPLKKAMEKMDTAERAMAEQNYPLARRLAEEAQVDAQLAAVSARSAKAQKAARELQEDNRVLRQEIERQTQ